MTTIVPKALAKSLALLNATQPPSDWGLTEHKHADSIDVLYISNLDQNNIHADDVTLILHTLYALSPAAIRYLLPGILLELHSMNGNETDAIEILIKVFFDQTEPQVSVLNALSIEEIAAVRKILMTAKPPKKDYDRIDLERLKVRLNELAFNSNS